MTQAVSTPAEGAQAPGTDVALTTSDFTANFDVSVVYNNKTYTLYVLSKDESQASGAYGVLVTETTGSGTSTQTSTLVQFAFKDEANWNVTLSLPPHLIPPIGGVTVSTLSIVFGEGTAKITPPTTPPS